MPINRRVMKSGTPEGSVTAGKLANKIYQRHYSAENAQDEHAGEHIKKRTVGIGREEKHLGRYLTPRFIFPCNEKQSQSKCRYEPAHHGLHRVRVQKRVVHG